MGDCREDFQRNLRVVDDVMRDHIDRRCGPLVNRAAQLVGRGAGRLADRHDLGAGEPDGLLDRRAVADHVAGLDQRLRSSGRSCPAGVRWRRDPAPVMAGCDRQADRGRTGGGDEAGLGAGELGDDWLARRWRSPSSTNSVRIAETASTASGTTMEAPSEVIVPETLMTGSKAKAAADIVFRHRVAVSGCSYSKPLSRSPRWLRSRR